MKNMILFLSDVAIPGGSSKKTLSFPPLCPTRHGCTVILVGDDESDDILCDNRTFLKATLMPQGVFKKKCATDRTNGE